MGRTDCQTIDRAAVALEAAVPRVPGEHLSLLERLVLELVQPVRQPPTAALGAAGRLTKGTNRAGHRAGRARLASQAATYLNWMAPPPSWPCLGAVPAADRSALAWRVPSGQVLVDVLGCGDRSERAVIGDVFDAATGLGDVAAVRLLHVGAPRVSQLYDSPSSYRPLAGTQWCFVEMDW